MSFAVKEKIVTKTHASVQDCSEDLDLVFICTPISTVNSTIQLVSEYCGDSVLITDVASIKQGIESLHFKKTQRFIGGQWQELRAKRYSHSSAQILSGAKYILTGTLTDRDLDFARLLKILIF